ncbi:aminotransferase class I/II-fold pyridoxal phosphate-dependent enzyme [Croceiramulus getboli]|nr:8-amino-7-oxononanoate synthase [Flavobacteriaceae bacterium YJPT1-3]
MLPHRLQQKLEQRQQDQALRSLAAANELIDFSSNDYLGFARDHQLQTLTKSLLEQAQLERNGATGSRLLSGNHQLYPETEAIIAQHHGAEAALIFNSGYDANLGFFQSVPQRNEVILYDELVHASIRDGLQLSQAKAYKFRHNDLNHLEELMLRNTASDERDHVVYVVTESVFSMDGDQPDLKFMANLVGRYNALLVVDEAHAFGVIGEDGKGLVADQNLEDQVFARLITFGKSLGSHGAAILGSADLKRYLVNFARSLIYTTGLPPHTVAQIQAAYVLLQKTDSSKKTLSPVRLLQARISFFLQEIKRLHLLSHFISSTSAIHCLTLPGNAEVSALSRKLKQQGFDVRPILAPTVPKGQERLRFCLHSFNSEAEITKVLTHLKAFLDN